MNEGLDQCAARKGSKPLPQRCELWNNQQLPSMQNHPKNTDTIIRLTHNVNVYVS